MEGSEKPTQELNFVPESSDKGAPQDQHGSKRPDDLSGLFSRIPEALAFSWFWIIPCICVFGVFIILIYAIQLPSGVRWGAFGVGVVAGSSAFLLGGLVGFLFGIPRTVQGSTPSADITQYVVNTNLEQVSDWLTKIIVGVSLVEIGRIIPALTKLAEILKAPLGGQPSSAAFGLGVVIASALTGFFFFYLWTREEFLEELDLLPFRREQSRKAARRTDFPSADSGPKS
jgi:hypothetical protein